MIENLIFDRLNDASITGICPQLYSVDPGQNTPIPFIYFSIDSNTPTHTLTGVVGQNFYDLTIHVLAPSLSVRNSIHEAIKGRLQGYRGGYLQGVFLASEQSEMMGDDEEGVVCHGVQSYRVVAVSAPVVASADSGSTSFQGLPAGGSSGQVLAKESGTDFDVHWIDESGGGGSGTVTSVSVTTHSGVSGTVATSTTTPAISISLGAITPTSVAASGTVTGSNLSGTSSGTNTGDQTITLTGDVTGSGTGNFATAIGAGKVTNAMLAGSITSSKLTGTDITTVGTISTGTWNATTLAINHGGTGQTTANAALNALLPTQTSNSGKVLQTDGTNTSWATAGGGGGGWSPYPTFTPAGVDDEFDGGSFSGWTAVGTSPTPTTAQANNKLSILHPGGDSAAKFYSWMKSATVSVGDWIECAFRTFSVTDQFPMFGIIFADGITYGSGNQMITMYSAAQDVLYTASFTGYNTLGSYVSPSLTSYDRASHFFLRLQMTASNSFTSQVSCDGQQWVTTAASFSRTITPTYVGFGCTKWGGGTYSANWSLEYFRKY